MPICLCLAYQLMTVLPIGQMSANGFDRYPLKPGRIDKFMYLRVWLFGGADDLAEDSHDRR